MSAQPYPPNPIKKGSNSPIFFSLNVRNTFALIVVPLGACLTIPWVPANRKTWLFGIFYAYLRSFAIVTGYHRLWAHKTYTASTALKLIFALLGAGAGQDHIKKWARDHRAHHRYVDTDQDPYNVKQGFFYAHMGWILFENNETSNTGYVDISDLKSDRIVQWQQKNFVLLFIIMGYLVPAIICGLAYGDFTGGLIYAGCIATALQQQLTFCVNSVAHWIGDQPYTDAKSARQIPWATAILLNGEGYHNYHHEFPTDYRTGIQWYDIDPGKWLISLYSFIGLASNLKSIPQNEINKSVLQRKLQLLEKEGEKVNWGIPLDELPVWKWEDYEQEARTGRNLIVIRGAVHDVSAFVNEHPGGPAMIAGAIGKDATKLFEGEIYRHSNAASNLLDQMRIALIKES
ncbi:Acyl-CoA desaturase [Penicillium chermesinum]|uniref:Acyl-CoA desaturase n=1 Tax=Penicillium chermesinum TaxID=63820 RepID=A0A9W9N7Z3_9EURO|nr:Acyl-CoA desaturase [Penicillium chermesinum]KAJ5214882.1 Acyl-CoA desaturase [Penicillium chermesinum]KAJ6141615.1 Acyl-CoA desaturase [Penicillium chermesinum]